MRLSTFLSRLLLPVASLALALATPSAVGQNRDDDPSFQLSDRAAEELGRMKELFDTQRFDEVLRRVDEILPRLANPSLDRAIMHQVQAQIALNRNDEPAAIAALEAAIGQNRLENRVQQEFRFYLAQLYYSRASEENPRGYDRAVYWIDQWLAAGAKPTIDQMLLHASLLYQMNRNRESLEIARRSLMITPTPREQQLILVLANQQALQDNEGAAQTLELLVREKPDSATYWGQLRQTYLAIGNDLRAIVATERGMAAGQFKTEQDYFTLIGLYYNLGAYGSAASLIEQGFTSGKLPKTQQNWELLAFCWQLLNDVERSIAVLGRASAELPAGDVDFMQAQLLYNLGRIDDAFTAAKRAWDKGGVRRPAQVLVLYGALALETRNFDDARRAVEALGAYPEAADDLKQLQDQMTAMLEIRERELQDAARAATRTPSRS